MALPASGQIDFGQIQTEFGGSNPISMNEYGDKIGLTVGTTSAHDMADFYGLSNTWTVTEGSELIGTVVSNYGYNSQGTGTFGSISPTTWSSANILQLFTLTTVIKGSSSYSLKVTFSGNQSTSFFSSISIGGVSHAMSTFTRNYASPNTYFSKGLTSSQVMDGSGTTTVIFT